jgi:alpha-L-rhamnosidase
MKRTLLTLLAALQLATTIVRAAEVAQLRCEYRKNPLGVDSPAPILSWIMDEKAADKRGQRQTAYRVVVASTPELLASDKGDLWDSGKLDSDQSIQVAYAGKPLESAQQCFWKVCVWDQDGKPLEWSKPAFWSMGLLKPEDWTAKWVGLDGNEPDPVDKKNVVPTASAASQAPGNLKILKATYTARSGAGSADVTKKVSSLVKDDALDFPVDPEVLGGDPALGHVKDLVVEFELNGKQGKTSVVDFGQLAVPFKLQRSKADPARLLRKDFRVDKKVARATAYFSGLGLSELYLNGQKVGDAVLSPGLTHYTSRVFYKTYDVTSLLRPGENVVGAILGNGRYHAPGAGGSRMVGRKCCSNWRWNTPTGPASGS